MMRKKKNKKYKLIPFLLYHDEEMTVVQNEQVTVVLLDEKLIDFFGKYDGIYDLSFSFNDLVELYDDKADFWLEFLLKNKLASENIKKIQK